MTAIFNWNLLKAGEFSCMPRAKDGHCTYRYAHDHAALQCHSHQQELCGGLCKLAMLQMSGNDLSHVQSVAYRATNELRPEIPVIRKGTTGLTTPAFNARKI